ncbi:hypothetical protein D3C81_07060 [compost metagenome]
MRLFNENTSYKYPISIIYLFAIGWFIPPPDLSYNSIFSLFSGLTRSISLIVTTQVVFAA